MRWGLTCLGLLGLWLGVGEQAIDAQPPAQTVQAFEQHIRPLLAAKCWSCHGETKQKGGLRLDSHEAMLTGGDSGPALEPGDPDASLLVEAIRYDAGLQMPPSGKLSDAEITRLTQWVAQGAPWPVIASDSTSPSAQPRKLGDGTGAGMQGTGVGASPPAQPEPKANGAGSGLTTRVWNKAGQKITDADRNYWAYQPRKAVSAPNRADLEAAGAPAAWLVNPIDAFVYTKQQEHQLRPMSEADKATLIRRATWDLWGLPPTPEDVELFVQDKSPQAYEALIDRLLADPRYGERWGRHWLDLARYAESDGHRQDAYRPDAWRYRDYVIQAFNTDKPYDRFVQEQLAGDELAPQSPEALVATGFLRHTPYEFNQRDVVGQWQNILYDVTDVTSEVFLGLGLACARCHDHKFDPILQSDYYRFSAFFAPIAYRDQVPLVAPDVLAEHQTQRGHWEAMTQEVRFDIAKVEAPYRNNAQQGALDKFPAEIKTILSKAAADRTPYEQQLFALAWRQVDEEWNKIDTYIRKKEDKALWAALQAQLAEDQAHKPGTLPTGMIIGDIGPVAPPTVMPGDRQNTELAPGFPVVLGGDDAEIVLPAHGISTGRRLALARWITKPDHPLTARVWVNRVWQYHFGRGLVASSGDFGRLGESPTHPLLLDWMANHLVTDLNWHLKPLHKLIMMSATYRQASTQDAQAVATSTSANTNANINTNVSASVSALTSARIQDPENRYLWKRTPLRLDAEQLRDGLLAVSGELVPSHAHGGGPSVAFEQPYRTIYTKIYRNTRDPLLDVFDAPESFASVAVRNHTTTPLQALTLINGAYTLDRAQAFAQRLLALHPSPADQGKIIRLAFQWSYGRAPTVAESAQAVSFLSTQAHLAAETANPAAARLAALSDFCHALMNSNEFLYID